MIDNPRNRIDRDLEPLGWVGDMTDMIEQGGLDIDALNQSAVEQIRARSDGGLYGVPLFIDDYLLFYNKKIFDKFDVPYPEAGSSYDEIFETAKLLTRQSGLDAYKGYLQHPDNYLEYNQLGVYPFLPTASEEPAPEDVKVDITTRDWMTLGNNIDRFLTLPRNGFTTVDDLVKGDMSRPGHVAMAVDVLHKLPMYSLSELYVDDGDEETYTEWTRSVEVGVTSVPVLDQAPTSTYQPNALAAFIPPPANQKDAAFNVVKWLVSEEAQTQLSGLGVKGVLETDAVVESFGNRIPELAGVDTSAVYWGDNAMVRNYENTEFWDIPMYMVFRQHVLKDAMDVRSSLIGAEREDIPAYIAAKAEAGDDW